MTTYIDPNITAIFKRFVDSIERIAATLEAQREDAKKSADPDHITTVNIRSANRELLIAYADALGVIDWCEKHGVTIGSVSNLWIRKRCLEAHAGDDLNDEDD